MRLAAFWVLIVAATWWLHEDGASISRYQVVLLVLLVVLTVTAWGVEDKVAKILRRLADADPPSSGE
jgi:UDP-N-acetylmuramyl pentapeptide phosphotransferase/UDP-N-acetylglucosamine-1-phosphate transferase